MIEWELLKSYILVFSSYAASENDNMATNTEIRKKQDESSLFSLSFLYLFP